MQQRYYDPIAGRFLSVDPVVTDANTGKGFGLYTYVDNNPYAKTDPDGRFARAIAEACARVPACAAAGAALAGAIGKAISNILQNAEKPPEQQGTSTEGGKKGDAAPTPAPAEGAPGTSNPLEGEPGSCSTCNNVKGDRKQDRYYGPDGWPEKDVDYDHDHKGDDGKKTGKPHVHDWKRPPDGGRPSAEDRGPARPPKPEEVRK